MKIAAAALLATLALVAAGCGGSSSSDSATEDTTTVESTASDTTETTTDTSSDTTDTTSTEIDEDALAKALGSKDCAQLATVGAKFAQAMGAAEGDSGDLEDTQKYFDDLAENAPEEIRDDFAVMAEAWTAIVDVYSDMGLKLGETPTQDQIEKFSKAGEELSKKLDDAKFEEASKNISTWAQENCSAVGNG